MKKRFLLFMLACLMTPLVAMAQTKEAYVVANDMMGTLTFYFDDKKATFTAPEETVYGINEKEMNYDVNENAPKWLEKKDYISSVVFDASFADFHPTNTSNWFATIKSPSFDDSFRFLKTDQVTDMHGMFRGTEWIYYVDLHRFDMSKVTNTSFMFFNSGLSYIICDTDWSKLPNLKKSDNMFLNAKFLEGGNGTKYDAKHVDKSYARPDVEGTPGYFTMATPDPYVVFEQIGKYWHVTFYYDKKMDSRPQEHLFRVREGYWETPDWTTEMKDYLEKVDEVYFDKSFADYKPKTTNSWFKGFTDLEEIPFEGNLEYLNTEEVQNMGAMFYGCERLEELNLTGFKMGAVENTYQMFKGCEKLTTIYATNAWHGAFAPWLDAANSVEMFEGCTKLKGGLGTTYDAGHVDFEYAQFNPGYFTYLGKEAYATFDETAKTLTFFYDDRHIYRKDVYKATWAYNSEEMLELPTWFALHDKGITKAVFDKSFGEMEMPMYSAKYFFYMFNDLTSVEGWEYLKVDGETEGFFYGCNSLKSVDMSKVAYFNSYNMSHFFHDCNSLESVNLKGDNIYTESCTNLGGMFYYCESLKSIDISGLYMPYLDRVDWMFAGCKSLTSLDLSSLKTSYLTDMTGMMSSCSSLKTVDLGNLNLGSVSNFNEMFADCAELTTIFCRQDLTYIADTESEDMFKGCVKLVGGNGTKFDDTKTHAEYARLDEELNKGYFTAPTIIYAQYTKKNATLTFYFDKGYADTDNPDTYIYNAEMSYQDWQAKNAETKHVKFDASMAKARPTNMAEWFSYFSILEDVDFTNLNTSEVRTMSSLFSNSKVKSVNMGGLDTKNVTTMEYMFNCCDNLEYLNLAGFNTENVTNMYSMFYGCASLKSLNITHFNTANVTDMSQMFYGCESLETLETRFDTHNVEYMYYMLANCSKLKWFDLTGFNIDKLTECSGMFSGCAKLATIYSNINWNEYVSINGMDMFSGCYSLPYYDDMNPYTTGLDYAHIDQDGGAPGHFTRKVVVGIEQPAIVAPVRTVTEGIFDMQGRRINGQPTKPGLYIINGRKTVIR